MKVAVNPFNPQKMLLLRWRWDTGVYANALYYSDDGGTSWSTLFTGKRQDGDSDLRQPVYRWLIAQYYPGATNV